MKNVIVLLIVCMISLLAFVGCEKSEPEKMEMPSMDTAAAKMEMPDMDAAAAKVSEAASTVTKQTTCPIMGGKINKDIFVEHKGQKVYFCCKACVTKFQADPEKYLAKLPQFKK